MFESVEIGHKTSKSDYDEAEPLLRTQLLDMQYELLVDRPFSVVVLINGVDGAGKGETVNLLNEWMDPRHIEAWAFDAPTSEELERPYMWRFWRALPPKGKIGVLFGNWYTQPIRDRVAKVIKTSDFDQRLDDITRFESMLVREGVLLIKLWFHLSKDGQKARLKSLEEDPRTRWRVTDRDWRYFKQYDRFKLYAEHMIRRTSTGRPRGSWSMAPVRVTVRCLSAGCCSMRCSASSRPCATTGRTARPRLRCQCRSTARMCSIPCCSSNRWQRRSTRSCSKSCRGGWPC